MTAPSVQFGLAIPSETLTATASSGGGARPAHGRARPRHVSPRTTELLALIDSALDDLVRWVREAEPLLTARQTPSVPFLTPDARARLDDQVRAERKTRHQLDKLGMTAPGESPAPLGVAAASIEGEAHDYLADLADRLVARLRLAGICWIGEVHHQTRLGRVFAAGGNPDDANDDRRRRASTAELVAVVRPLVHLLAKPKPLERIHRDLEDLTARAKRVVRGEDRSSHHDPCPHCGRHTLVVHLEEGVIRCEADPATGRRELCRCADTYCPCRRGNPLSTKHRHEWHRAERAHKATSWRGLRRAQNDAHRRTIAMNDAIAAVERIRALHQPTWTDDAGAEHTHLAWVGDWATPAGHVCRAPDDPDGSCIPGDEDDGDLHAIPACVHCVQLTEAGAEWVPFPCPTIRAIDDPAEVPQTSGSDDVGDQATT